MILAPSRPTLVDSIDGQISRLGALRRGWAGDGAGSPMPVAALSAARDFFALLPDAEQRAWALAPSLDTPVVAERDDLDGESRSLFLLAFGAHGGIEVCWFDADQRQHVHHYGDAEAAVRRLLNAVEETRDQIARRSHHG